MRTTLTRRYRFSASHVLARADWSPERNQGVYGKCANPAGHGHNYGLEVTVKGKVDATTGALIPLAELDALVARHVLEPLDRKLLNRDVQAFRQEVPTAENIARFAWRALSGRLGEAALHRIRLVETVNNSVEYSEDPEAGAV